MADLQLNVATQLPAQVFDLDWRRRKSSLEPLSSSREQVDSRWPTWPLPIRM